MLTWNCWFCLNIQLKKKNCWVYQLKSTKIDKIWQNDHKLYLYCTFLNRVTFKKSFTKKENKYLWIYEVCHDCLFNSSWMTLLFLCAFPLSHRLATSRHYLTVIYLPPDTQTELFESNTVITTGSHIPSFSWPPCNWVTGGQLLTSIRARAYCRSCHSIIGSDSFQQLYKTPGPSLDSLCFFPLLWRKHSHLSWF